MRFYDTETRLSPYNVSKLRTICRKLLYFPFQITIELTKKRKQPNKKLKKISFKKVRDNMAIFGGVSGD